MAFVTSKITACECAFCAAEMAGELTRNQSENLPIKRACPRLWCRAQKQREVTERGAITKKAPTNYRKGLILLARPAGIEPTTKNLEGSCSIQLSYGRTRQGRRALPCGAQYSDSDPCRQALPHMALLQQNIEARPWRSANLTSSAADIPHALR